MIARIHYDRRQLQDFLESESDSASSELAEHVETCCECQAQLESIAQADFDWDEATRLLAAEVGGSRADVPSADAQRPSFLDPTEQHDSLGRFSRFEVLEFLGRGGMGIVMRAYDTALQRHCAVKVLSPELAGSAAARKRFSREARSAAAVVHPHVVPIQTVDEHNGLPYLVMPVVEGKSLQQRVETDGVMTVIETVRIASQVAEGLAAAHGQGLVHRDIKPANILLENGVERVQITDFGLARAVDDASMTRSGVIAGTPQYMSPEQAHGDSIDHRSDLFSLGSVMYFMLTGRSPFRAETTMGVLNRIGSDQPRSLRCINAEVPSWLEQIIFVLLNKSPDERYQTAAEVAQLLRDWHAHLLNPQANRPVLRTPAIETAAASAGKSPPPRRWIGSLAAFAFVAIAATVILLETSKGTLRIETNSENPIPILIRRDGKVVDNLSATRDGTFARLRAGEYVLEVDSADSTIRLQGDKVSIDAGGKWLVRIESRDTSAVTIGRKGPGVALADMPPKITPFTRMEFDQDHVIVTFNGERFELLGVEHFSIEELVDKTREMFRDKWRKRLSEDLVEVLWRLGCYPGDRIDLRLRSLATNAVIDVDDALMTHRARMMLYLDNEHNQPSAIDAAGDLNKNVRCVGTIVGVRAETVELSIGRDDGLELGQRIHTWPEGGGEAEIVAIGTDRSWARLRINDPKDPFKVGRQVYAATRRKSASPNAPGLDLRSDGSAAERGTPRTSSPGLEPRAEAELPEAKRLLSALQGNWEGRFTADSTGEDRFKIQVVGDVLHWMDAEGETQRFLLAIDDGRPAARLAIREVAPDIGVHVRHGIIRGNADRIEICLNHEQPPGPPPSVFENNQAQAVIKLERPSDQKGAIDVGSLKRTDGVPHVEGVSLKPTRFDVSRYTTREVPRPYSGAGSYPNVAAIGFIDEVNDNWTVTIDVRHNHPDRPIQVGDRLIIGRPVEGKPGSSVYFAWVEVTDVSRNAARAQVIETEVKGADGREHFMELRPGDTVTSYW
ncbi:serine/threonine protein kinase [Roseiconus nitratireducens]|uniref:non-specific serine/threonine protein kinase n=1 Tax=Roseiconus nitratireducens TaxID=2605748 RepID=A0A5M6D5A3_9BACT|nr:serine/threonine-protein kinase [Roseiconus nitratireducens]KAA5542697.1 serine/threonine protein kinase [Roseiconus nitratireducens]